MDFGYAILYVPSVPEAVAFYERAFGFTDSFVHEGKDYGELRTGATKLAFTAHELAAKAVPTPYRAAEGGDKPLGMELTLTTTELDAAHQRAVDAGARELSAPHDTPWGQRVSYVLDLNGVIVGLATPMS
ncbi:MAG: VOC family protein [Myxococcales bacterium]|nr:VOC family protein [Myxococcales bacterium]